MSAGIAVTFESGQVIEVPDLPISAGGFTPDAILRALPSAKRLTSALRDDPETAAEMVNHYMAGRMDAAQASAERLGVVDGKAVVDGRAQVETPSLFGIIILIIIAIIIILLFPKTVK